MTGGALNKNDTSKIGSEIKDGNFKNKNAHLEDSKTKGRYPYY